jgi:hypothetical protein
MNKAAAFFEDCLVITRDDDDHVANGDMRNVYRGWCEENNVRHPLSPDKLAKRLRLMGVTGGDDDSRINGERTWHGVKLRDDLPNEASWPK